MCFKCLNVKVGRHMHAHVGKFPSPDERFKHIHIDITGPLPVCEGESYLLTCVDRFFQLCFAVTMPDMSTYSTTGTFKESLVIYDKLPLLFTSVFK